ncbi:MAG: RNA polymerase sigma factor [Clostridiales bacterium]|nr:RNA polymerase sigma factor [Clostridiales bacterium]
MIDEKTVIKKAAEGDRDAFGELVAVYAKRLYGFLYAILQDEHDCLDIVQETFFKAYKNIFTFDTNRSFVTWLFTIAKNNAFNYLKSRNRNDLGYESLDNIESKAEGPEEKILKKEETKRLVDAISRLPEKYKAIIYLKYISNLSYREIGKRLNIKESLVESRIYTARQKIASFLKEGV